MQRVLIIGQPGAGKSTLGRALARITGLPLVHLDRHYWQPGWRDSDPEAWTATVRRLAAEPRWIIEGNYAGTLPLRLARADTVIHLDFPRWLCFARVIRRILWGKRPGELPPGCPERFDGEFLRYTWQYRLRQRAKDLALLEGFSGTVLRFGTPRSLRDFLRGLGQAPPPMDAAAAFRRYAAMGGVLDFSVREDSQGTSAEILVAFAQLLGEADVAALRPRRIERDSFLGDWHDPAQGLLLKRGEYVTADGLTLVNPPFTLLEGVRIRTGVGQVPAMGAGGQFAYAFAEPPYPLTAPPGEVQAVFAGIRDFLLPPGHAVEILDWSSPELPRVSPYFEQGAEWWGMFLFSIHVPALKRLIVVAGSASD